MATDRTVSWSLFARRKPTLRDVRRVCEDYVRGTGARVWFEGDRFYIVLPGTTTHPLRRVAAPPPYEEPERERWIEVWKGVIPGEGRTIVDVMTRCQDEVTNAVARGLAEVFARYWCSKVEW